MQLWVGLVEEKYPNGYQLLWAVAERFRCEEAAPVIILKQLMLELVAHLQECLADTLRQQRVLELGSEAG